MEEVNLSQRVWRRAVAMLLIGMRFDIESRFWDDRLYEDDYEFAERILGCLQRHEKIIAQLTPNEKVLSTCEIGEWPISLHIQYSWHIEAVGCLLWCINQIERFPSHEINFDMTEIDRYFGNIEEKGISNWAQSLLDKTFDLRDPLMIQYQLTRAEMVYQRCTIGSYIRDGKRQMSPKRYDELFPLKQYDFPIGTSGDLLVDGKEFCDMSQDEEGDLAPLALIRIQTFRWVMDNTIGWDDLDVDYLEELPK